MSILLDTGVWYAYLHEDDENHESAEAIVADCMEGTHGAVATTRDVVGETFTLLMARGAPWAAVEAFATLVGVAEGPRGPRLATVLEIPEERHRAAWPLFERHYQDKELSYTDCTTLATVRRRGIDALATFDEGFEGLVETVP